MPSCPEKLPYQIRQIVQAPLQLGRLNWTSEDIASHLGVSQSRVARAWRKLYFEDSSLLSLPNQIIITAIKISSQHSYILCQIEDGSKNRSVQEHASVMRSPRRFSLQALLAAQILAREHQKSESKFEGFKSLSPSLNEMIMFTTDDTLQMPGVRVTTVSEDHWQGLLSYLVQASFPTPAVDLKSFHQDLIIWSLSPESEFLWRSGQITSSQKINTRTSPSVKSTQQVVADQVFDAIVNRIWNGLLTAGDRITEASLARELHTTRNQTRDAIRSLISLGLIDHDTHRGAIVPAPSTKDVIDIYTARKALGVEILKRAINNESFEITTLRNSLLQLEEIAGTGNSYETGNADLRFQDVIAANSGMRNIPQMFSTLAKQLQIYIAVMGITYVYSIEDMIKDDRNIFNYILDKELDLAIEAWQKKVDDSLAFMTNHVSRNQRYLS